METSLIQKMKFRLGTLSILLFAAAESQAHPGHSHGSDLGAGMVHTLAGMDHLLFAVAIGVVLAAVNDGRRSRFSLFMPAMLTVGGYVLFHSRMFGIGQSAEFYLGLAISTALAVAIGFVLGAFGDANQVVRSLERYELARQKTK